MTDIQEDDLMKKYLSSFLSFELYERICTRYYTKGKCKN